MNLFLKSLDLTSLYARFMHRALFRKVIYFRKLQNEYIILLLTKSKNSVTAKPTILKKNMAQLLLFF